jgi:general secretion pathway protein F
MTIEAPDRSSALREIVRRGQTPVRVEELAVNGNRRSHAVLSLAPNAKVGAPSATGAIVSALGGNAMSQSQMAMFIRELATAIMAGLPLIQALRTIAKQGRSVKQKVMLAKIIEDVEHGQSLADATENWGRPFTELTVSMMRAGEASGKLGEVLTQAADLLDRDMKLRRSIISAIIYPAMLVVLISIAVVIIVTVIVPRVLKSVGGRVSSLPWATQVVQGVAAFFGGYWWIIIPTIAIAIIGAIKVYQLPTARLWIDDKLLRVPVLGRMLKDVAVARFTRTLGTLTSSGIPILTSLKITRNTLGNKAMESVIDEVAVQVTAGKTIAEPMERSGYFPPMLVQIVNLGERSGRLDEMLHQAANAFEDRTEMSVKMFTTILPPVLVVFLAGIVGFVVYAIMSALMAVQDNLGA